jgi:putative nucleotidyltransferase with HDIG domain
MYAVPIAQLKPGILLGRDLVDSMGQVLLYRGVCLTPEYIDSLQDRGYSHVYVRKEDDPDIAPEEDVSPVVRLRATKALSKAIQDVASHLSALRKETFEDMTKAFASEHVRVLMSQKKFFSEIQDLVSAMLDEMLDKAVLAGLTSMKNRDARLYDHAIDVCAVAIMIGKVLDLRTLQMRNLATGCLLHDIGMLFVDPAQSETVRVRQHTILGYELLRNTDEPDILSPHVAFEHHERQDGTGLPRGLVGSNRIKRNREQDGPVPTLIGEVAAVANYYDNLISASHDRPPTPTDMALAQITSMAGTHFNREIIAAFRRVVPVYPKGTDVSLRGMPYDKFSGIVSDVNPQHLDRPFVILLRDGKGQKIVPIEIDTLKFPQVILRTIGV